jgi:hypothetical protein
MRVFLLGGTGRSGTGILKRAIGRHPEIATLPVELRFVIDPDGIVDLLSFMSHAWSPFDCDLRIRRLEALLRDVGSTRVWDKILNWCVMRVPNRYLLLLGRKVICRYPNLQIQKYATGFDKEAERLISRLQSFHYRGVWEGLPRWSRLQMRYVPLRRRDELAEVLGEFLRKIVGQIVEKQGRMHFLDGTDWNILWIERLRDLIPDALLVHVYRDPRDVVASYVQQRYSPKDMKQATCFYKDLISRWFEVRKRLSPDTFLEVSLESLVKDPEGTLRKVCSFLGVPFTDELLKIDLSKSNSGRWMRDFDESEQKWLNEALREEIQVLGYGRRRPC